MRDRGVPLDLQALVLDEPPEPRELTPHPTSPLGRERDPLRPGTSRPGCPECDGLLCGCWLGARGREGEFAW